MNTTPEQLRICADLLESKSHFQVHHVDKSDEWTERYRDTSPLWYLTNGYTIRPAPLTFPPKPEQFTWHNRDNLTPEQVGEGWRLLVISEVCDSVSIGSGNHFVQKWKGASWCDNKGIGFLGVVDLDTYRVPISTPFPDGSFIQDGKLVKPERPKPVPWNDTSDFPKVPTIWIRSTSDYREHMVIGFANPCAIITVTCGSSPVLQSIHLTQDGFKGMEWSENRETWTPCSKLP